MSMKREIEKFSEEMTEVMNRYMSREIDVNVIRNMDGEEFELLTRSLNLLLTAKNIMIQQAEWMDNIDKKLDKLLAKK